MRQGRPSTKAKLTGSMISLGFLFSACMLGASTASADELHDAVRAHDLAAVTRLLESGADTEMTDFFLGTPLHIAVAEGQAEIAATLIAHGANPNTPSEQQGANAMHLAAKLGAVRLLSLLVESGAAIDSRDSFERTPLFEAAAAGKPEAVKLLLAKGADLEARDSNYRHTPLMSAALAGNSEIVHLLVDAGADINAKGRSGRTPLRLAATAESYGNVGDGSLIDFLVAHGADINAKDNSGQTPLAWAVSSSGRVDLYKQIAQELRSLGAAE